MEQQAKAPPDLKKVAQFLRSGGAGMKVRVGALNGKRVDYFKGTSRFPPDLLFVRIEVCVQESLQ